MQIFLTRGLFCAMRKPAVASKNLRFPPICVSLQFSFPSNLMREMVKSYWHHVEEVQVFRDWQEEEIQVKGKEGSGC